eukprot:TRINITY_DN3352_c0_g1_i14.p1 TRINITY_DN3352_c0_g1~~TRINITY_DN3352_c0_g1_i14.p1  ORF type:complete len:440 (-),score=81.32 TRINITY_DN3352_c0_g1_i14:31-1350(-)
MCIRDSSSGVHRIRSNVFAASAWLVTMLLRFQAIYPEHPREAQAIDALGTAILYFLILVTVLIASKGHPHRLQPADLRDALLSLVGRKPLRGADEDTKRTLSAGWFSCAFLALATTTWALKYARVTRWDDLNPNVNLFFTCPTFLGSNEYIDLNCAHSWLNMLMELLFPPFLLLDYSLHKQYWEGGVQMLLKKHLKGLHYFPFALSSNMVQLEKMLAAGSEGEVYRAVLVGEDEEPVEIVAKLPHLEGLEALDEMLEEIRVLIHIQQWKDQEKDTERTEGFSCVVGFKGFCVELPLAACCLERCSGDLTHWLELNRTLELGAPTVPTVPTMGRSGPEPPAAPVKGEADSRQALARRILWALQVGRLCCVLTGLQIAKAMQALHSIGVAHLDLKSDNVLLRTDDANGDVCVTDFGCSSMGPVDQDHEVNVNTGTKAFMVL